MNNEEMRILGYLSDNLGSGSSILEMSGAINKKYGHAYYSNIYKAAKGLEKAGIISIAQEGRNRLIGLNAGNPLSTYCMAELEDHKASQTAIPRDIIERILELAEKSNIFSICALEAEKYLKINRIELLLLTKGHNEDGMLIESLLRAESEYNIRIDAITLTLEEFIKTMESDEASPLKDMILDKCILYNSTGFWELIRRHKLNAKYKRLGRFPKDIGGGELAYNYSRLGYRLQEEIIPSDKISLEATIFSMSTMQEARIRYGAFVLMYKNINKINWGSMFYLYKRYDELGMLKGMLYSLAGIGSFKDNAEIKLYASLIPGKPSATYDKGMIKKYVELY